MVLPINGDLQRLQWFVQTTMPAVYDDSLSYYELLNKVAKQLDTNTDFTNGVKTTLNDLITLVNSDKWINEKRIGDKQVSTRTIQDGAVTTSKIDPAIMSQPTTAIGVQAKLTEIDEHFNQLSLNATKYDSFSEAVIDAVNKGRKLFVPNGTYTIDTLIKITDDLTSVDANKPIMIEGETPNGVILTSSLATIIDFSKSKHVFMKNITSDKFIKIMMYGEDEPLNASREVVLENVLNLSTTGEPINWYYFVNSPQPDTYADNMGGKYSRYPFEITNFSGYNALNINNFSKSTEASAIGITDKGTTPSGDGLSSPTVLIDRSGAKRPIIQVQDNTNPTRHPTRNAVFEISDFGDVAIGTSTQADDGGFANLKIKRDNPSIKLYDPNTGRSFDIILSGSNVNMGGGITISVANNEVWAFPKFKIPVTIDTPGEGIILKTPDGGAQYKLSIDNAGALITTRL